MSQRKRNPARSSASASARSTEPRSPQPSPAKTGSLWGARFAMLVVFAMFVVVALMAQPEAPEPQRPGTVSFDDPLPLGTALKGSPVAAPVRDRAENLVGLISAFENDWKSMVSKGNQTDLRDTLGRLDAAYLQTGRYPEFVTTLDKIARAGSLLDSLASRLPAPTGAAMVGQADRLQWTTPTRAWALWRLGQLDAALKVANLAVARQPNNADSHMIRAFVLGQLGPVDEKEFAAIRAEFVKVLELDPSYRGFSINVSQIQQQIRLIDDQIGVAKPKAGNAVKAGTTIGGAIQKARGKIETSFEKSKGGKDEVKDEAPVLAPPPANDGAVAPAAPAEVPVERAATPDPPK